MFVVRKKSPEKKKLLIFRKNIMGNLGFTLVFPFEETGSGNQTGIIQPSIFEHGFNRCGLSTSVER